MIHAIVDPQALLQVKRGCILKWLRVCPWFLSGYNIKELIACSSFMEGDAKILKLLLVVCL